MTLRQKSNMKSFFFTIVATIVVVFFNSTVFAQKVEIIADAKISSLVAKHIAFNENRKGIKGFRIQIFFDSGNNSKSNAVSAMKEFTNKYSEIGAYLTFNEPNFKVRVGDFRTRLDAKRLLAKIIDEFPNSFIVIEDNVNMPSLEESY